MAFSSGRDGTLSSLYLKDASGARPEERLQKSEIDERVCDWSRDGRVLLYVRGRLSASKLWVLSDPADPVKRKAAPYLETPFSTTQGQFSPDSHWVAYSSDESRRGREIYVQSFPAGSGKFQVSNNGGVQPRWRGDGKELFYIAADGKLMAVDVKTTPTFQAGVPHALFDPHISGGAATNVVFRYDVTPDGQKFLVNSTGEAEPGAPESITVVLNWLAKAKN